MIYKILSFIIAFIIASGIFVPIVLWIEDLERKGTVFPDWSVPIGAFSFIGLVFFFHELGLSYIDKKLEKK
jgi:hypothetical protein